MPQKVWALCFLNHLQWIFFYLDFRPLLTLSSIKKCHLFANTRLSFTFPTETHDNFLSSWKAIGLKLSCVKRQFLFFLLIKALKFFEKKIPETINFLWITKINFMASSTCLNLTFFSRYEHITIRLFYSW